MATHGTTTPPKTPPTPVKTVLQKGTLTPAQKEQTSSSKAVSLIDSLLGKASLPIGTTISPQLQNNDIKYVADAIKNIQP